MTTAWDELAAAVQLALPAVNVYATPTDKLRAPAVVIRPDDPWMIPGPSLGALSERYLAILVVPAGSPADGLAAIHSMMLALIDALPADFALRDGGRMVVDESTGVPLLAAAVRLAYAL